MELTGLTLTGNTSHWCQMVNERFLVIVRLHQDGSYTVGWLKTQVLGFGFLGLRMYPDLVEGFWRVKPLSLCRRSRSLDSPRRNVSIDMWSAPCFPLVWERLSLKLKTQFCGLKPQGVETWHLIHQRLSIYDRDSHCKFTMYKLNNFKIQS